GLCGAFNANVIKQIKVLQAAYAGKQVDVLAIGKKGNDSLKKTCNIVDNKSSIFDELTFENVANVAQSLMDRFAAGEYDKIEVVYNHFKNAATQIVLTEQFLPLEPAAETTN